MKNTTCLNCAQALKGNYCSNCGQSASTDRLSLSYIWHDIQHGLLHLDKGILFTIKELFSRPGKSIVEFISGKRVKHFKPLSLVLLLAGFYGFLNYYFHINTLAENIQITGDGEKMGEFKNTVSSASNWISQHYSIISLIQIPIFALGSWICFRKKNYSFFEHLILNAFIIAQRLVLRLVAFPIIVLYNHTKELSLLNKGIDIVSLLLFMWAYFQIFTEYSKLKRIGLIYLSLLIAYALLFLLMMAGIGLIINKVLVE
ncbi:MAG TPA: DUF3667 domain-containing protein [Bacteroidia bacterium]|nr:DUF3667 domain-containing protein [Bacteroidia bacterium]